MSIVTRLLRAVASGIATGSFCTVVAATSVPIGYIAWDVTEPGTTGEFDIVNQTGINSSGDATWPVTSSLTFSALSLVVSFSNGTTSTFGGAYFTPSADGISFDGGAIAIGDGAALPTGAVLSGVLAPIDAALFDGQVDHFLAAFSARIAVRSGGLSDGDLAVIDASTAPVSTVPEPGIGWLFAAGLLPVVVARTRSRSRRASKVRPESAAAPPQWPRTLSIAAASLALAVPSLAAVKLNSWSAPSSGIAGKTLVNLTATGVPLQPNEMPQGVAVSFAESCGGSTIASTAASSVTAIVPTSIRIQVPLPTTLTGRTYAVSVTGTTSAGTFASGNCSLVNVAVPVDDWHTLIASNWSMPPHGEGYVCRIIVVQSDMYIGALRADSAPYLAIVTVADSSTNPYNGADFPCTAGSMFARGVFMAGPGTGELTMPAGVAVHVRPGQFLSINQHIVNDTDQARTGTTVIQVRTADSATITSEADLALAGTFQINIPSDGQRHNATGACHFNSDERVFALQPHLQSSGVHASLTRTRGAQQSTLIDTDYNLQSQNISQVAAGLQDVQVGDLLTTVCTYVNTSGQTKNYGEAEQNEQCFIGMYRTPANVPSNPAAPPIFACAEGMS